MSTIMCTHCRKKGEKMLCKSCYGELTCKACWNEGAAKNEMFSDQYLEILSTLNELVIRMDRLELNLNLAKRLKV